MNMMRARLNKEQDTAPAPWHPSLRATRQAVALFVLSIVASCGTEARRSAYESVQESELRKMKAILDEKELITGGSLPNSEGLKKALLPASFQAGDLFVADTEEGTLLMLVKQTQKFGVIATGMDASGKMIRDPHVKKRELLQGARPEN